MYFQLIVSSVLINFISASEVHDLSKNGKDNKVLIGSNGRTNTEKIKSTGYQLWNQHHWKPRKRSLYNITYIDKAENLIRLPIMNKYNTEKKSKKKTIKKSPRRTIQKIIKKNTRSKIKKLYVVKMTSSHPTVAPKYDLDNDQEDYSARKSEMTTRSNQQKKMKKYSVKQVKLPRYPMPYRQMQMRKNNKRPKREARDIFIFKDLDSMQFVKGKNNDDNYNVINAHFKKYW